MASEQPPRSPLETEPIQRLILRYAVPTAMTLMVNCLYNIVDQIFVGQGVGITAMAAINVAFPVVILVNAAALLLGDGSAANISLCLGRRQQREADDTIGHALTLILLSGLCAAAVSWCCAPQIARLCDISPQAAAFRMDQLRRLYQRDRQWMARHGRSCFFLSPREWRLYCRFEPYIRSVRARQDALLTAPRPCGAARPADG